MPLAGYSDNIPTVCLRTRKVCDINIIMKQYVIDELRFEDYHKIKGYLDACFGPPDMGDLYWIPLKASLYDKDQCMHASCHPLYLVIHLESSSLAAELLVRTKNRIRCDCIRYVNEAQLNWVIAFVDSIFSKLDIIT